MPAQINRFKNVSNKNRTPQLKNINFDKNESTFFKNDLSIKVLTKIKPTHIIITMINVETNSKNYLKKL